jgi:IS6 family transposase
LSRCPVRGGQYGNASIPRSSYAHRLGFGVRRVPVPARGHRLALRWYLRYELSYRDVEELLSERGIDVDHVTVFGWVQRFTPLLADAARPCRHIVGDRWFADETFVKVAGRWATSYRAIDQYGQIIDVYVSARRDIRAARRFFATARREHGEPVEVVTDQAPALRAAIDELMPTVFHNTEHYANNRIECDHGRLKARLRPMRGLKRDRSARGHCCVSAKRTRPMPVGEAVMVCEPNESTYCGQHESPN